MLAVSMTAMASEKFILEDRPEKVASFHLEVIAHQTIRSLLRKKKLFSMYCYNFKMILSFIHGNSFAEKDSNYVQKSHTNFYLSLENIKFSHYLELIGPQSSYYEQYKKNPHLFRTRSNLHS